MGTITSVAQGGDSPTEEHRALMISAQVMKKEGKLVRARDLLATCSSTPCGDASQASECDEIRAYCGKRLADVTNEIPTSSVRVEDDRGLPILPEWLEVDSLAVSPSKLTAFDPGPHEAKALYAGRIGEAQFVLDSGQRDVNVIVRIDLRETVQRRPIPLPVYALGATTIAAGLLALGTGIYTVRSYQGLDGCAPFCDPSQKGTLQATGYVTDISMLVALASAVGGTIWYFARPTVSEVRWLHSTTATERSTR
jgi:hypothetical protein